MHSVRDKVTKITSDFTHAIYMRPTTRRPELPVEIRLLRPCIYHVSAILVVAERWSKFFSAIVIIAVFTDAAVTDILAKLENPSLMLFHRTRDHAPT